MSDFLFTPIYDQLVKEMPPEPYVPDLTPPGQPASQPNEEPREDEENAP